MTSRACLYVELKDKSTEYLKGYWDAISALAVWKNGSQYVGVSQTPLEIYKESINSIIESRKV